MGAATQLDAVSAGLEDPHDLAVLLAEERDRPELTGLVHRGLEVAHRCVGEHLGVGQVLDRRTISASVTTCVVGEVEAEPVRRHQGALLLHVLTEHLRSAQCSTWVAVWFRRIAARRSSSMAAVACWPGWISPSIISTRWRCSPGQREGGVEHPCAIRSRWRSSRCRRPDRPTPRRTGWRRGTRHPR